MVEKCPICGQMVAVNRWRVLNRHVQPRKRDPCPGSGLTLPVLVK